jgi:GR25 family glycosyltransferase involved in LPS biosynthesis
MVFCISLKDSPRRAAFAASAKAHGVAFEFVDAIMPADLRRGATMEGCRIDLTDLRWTHHERFDPRRQQAPLMFAEIACAYSHMTCWRIGASRDLDHICVFEDDVVICRNPNGIDMPDGADMLYLNERIPHDEDGRITDDAGGTEGYLLSRNGIRKCLEIFRVLSMPVDLQIMAHHARDIRRDATLSDYRRDGTCTLNARVASGPCCVLSDDNESQIYDTDGRSALATRNRLRLERDLQDAVAGRDRLREELDALRRSTSWRLTAPIRAIGTAFARTRRCAARG